MSPPAGEGAPLAPLYHAALAAALAKPLAVLNLGGVGNVTWIGARSADDILAFDTGPGNALIDDWVRRHTGQAADFDGALARAGRVSADACRALSGSIRISRARRRNRSTATISAMPCREGLAARRRRRDPDRDDRRRGRGGARGISRRRRANGWSAAAAGTTRRSWRRWPGCSAVPVRPVEAVGWDGDALEAQAFAYLAVRSLRGLPLSLPTTTGAPRPMLRRQAVPGAAIGRDQNRGRSGCGSCAAMDVQAAELGAAVQLSETPCRD